MSYIVKSSEKLRKSGAEAETKALLYLMNFRTDSNDIYYFVVDFFNDLTGMDSMATRLWDLQSKGAHNVGPKAIGRELITLFKNYMSEFSFEAYILFVGSVSGTLRTDPSLTVFTTTLKHEEMGKYDSLEGVNHINYLSHTPSKILDRQYVDDFVKLMNSLSVKIQDQP